MVRWQINYRLISILKKSINFCKAITALPQQYEGSKSLFYGGFRNVKNFEAIRSYPIINLYYVLSATVVNDMAISYLIILCMTCT